MVWGDIVNLQDNYTSLSSSTMKDLEVDVDSGLEDDDIKHDSPCQDSIIFVAFKGNINDDDFKLKLGIILDNVPGLLHMGT